MNLQIQEVFSNRHESGLANGQLQRKKQRKYFENTCIQRMGKEKKIILMVNKDVIKKTMC